MCDFFWDPEPQYYLVKNEPETFIVARGMPRPSVIGLDWGFAWRLCENFVIQSHATDKHYPPWATVNSSG